MKNEITLENNRISDLTKVIYLDLIIGLSFLRFHWFFLVSCLVIIIEFLILNHFWREWKFSFRVSLLANIGSALAALPLLLLPIGYFSLWFTLIKFAENFVRSDLTLLIENQTLPFFLIVFSFFTIFVLSVLIEMLIAKALKAPKENISLIITVANLATYSLIMITLLGLGAGFGLLNQNPLLDAEDFFEGILFYSIPIDDPLGGLIWFVSILITYLSSIFGLIVIVGCIAWIVRNSLKKKGQSKLLLDKLN